MFLWFGKLDHFWCRHADAFLDTVDIAGDDWNAPAADQVTSSDVQQATAVAKNVIDLAGTVLLCYLVLGD